MLVILISTIIIPPSKTNDEHPYRQYLKLERVFGFATRTLEKIVEGVFIRRFTSTFRVVCNTFMPEQHWYISRGFQIFRI